jgi:hypothetical protein
VTPLAGLATALAKLGDLAARDRLGVSMSDITDSFLSEWHRIVAEKDLVALEATLTEDVTIGAPPYWEKLRGRPLVHHLLGRIVHTIEDFTYHREWQNERELALEFTGHVGKLDLQGIDLITLDENGSIRNLDVLMRPVNAVIALREVIAPQMAEFLAGRPSPR